MILKDADALKDWECEKCEYEHKDGYWCRESCGVMQRIDESKTIDAVPVVRCKDCKHWQWFSNVAGYTGDEIGHCEWAGWMVGENGYCVYGERKDDLSLEKTIDKTGNNEEVQE